MKKFLLMVIAFFGCIVQVQAEDSYFLWHNSKEDAYTTNYDGKISNQAGKYQNNTIESLGNHEIKLNNFHAYDVMLSEQTTWELNGNNTINFIEQSSDSPITLKGSGVLRFQEIGLSMEDMLNTKTPNLEEKIKTYLKGDYTLEVEEKFIAVRLNHEETTKDLSFENQEFHITIQSNSKVPSGTIFVAEDVLESFKEKINKKLKYEEVKYVYDFQLKDGENSIEPSEEVEVRIKLDNGKYTVYYYNDKEELEKMDSYYEDGYLKFKTSHFSDYAITIPKAEESEDNHMLFIGIGIFAVATVALVVIVKQKKH